MLHSLLLWSSHCLLHELAVLQSSFLLFPLSVASAGCGAGDLKLSSPLTGQVKMLLEENAALQVGLVLEKTRKAKQRTAKKQKRQGKTTPFGVNVINQVLYRFAQGVSSNVCMLSICLSL